MSFFDKPSNYPSDNFRSRNYSGIWQRKFIDEHVDSFFIKGIDETQKEFSNANQNICQIVSINFIPLLFIINMYTEQYCIFILTEKV